MLLGLVVIAATALARVPPEPAFAQTPAVNAFTIWQHAGDLISDSALRSTNNPRDFVASNVSVFGLFAQGLTNECQVPLAKDALSGLGSCRKLPLALNLEAHAFEAQGQPEKAAETYLQVTQLGEGIEHGAFIHLMCGIAVEKIGLGGLKSILPRLQSQDRKLICERLALLNKKRISFNEVQARERYYARIVEPNLFKRLWYSIYWRVYFFGFGPKPDVGEKYNSLITDIDETARTGAAQ